MEPINDPVEKEKAWEDLGRPEEPNKQFAFTISIHEDGAISTEVIEKDVKRKATMFDIYHSCRELVADIESHILADRVAKSVVAALQPVDPTTEVKEKLRSALLERGIDTPKA